MKSLKYLALAIALAASNITAPRPAQAANDVAALRKIRLLSLGEWSGDAGFKRRLIRDMKSMGFRFVPRPQAQGVVSARTSWKRGAFTGEMWIRNKSGRVLWHESAYRAPSSDRMVGAQLASKLRVALGR